MKRFSISVRLSRDRSGDDCHFRVCFAAIPCKALFHPRAPGAFRRWSGRTWRSRTQPRAAGLQGTGRCGLQKIWPRSASTPWQNPLGTDGNRDRIQFNHFKIRRAAL